MSARAQDARIDWMDVDDLSGEQIATLVLSDVDHAPIVDVYHPTRGMAPPGLYYLHLREKSVRTGDSGCTRRVWSVSFSNHPDFADGGQGFRRDSRTSWYEAALAPATPCQFASFARLADDIVPAQGVPYLLDLQRFVASDRAYTCQDATSSRLCASVRHELGNTTPWMIRRQGTSTVYWMSELGGPVTETTIPDDEAEGVLVRRFMPNPF
ncbi:hypothetical protein GRI62_02400 [Erythrobacter arachoides]|uniref:Uncharacterized protein n=1 Tax=Aurantiacibacter arachoides TaxID=1850444 RepID=A0A844ZZW2_9SPHN|nr:hypothetical protein [Aurantiacibacter arachoides]MXO92456.1 hypothetical protein [Aurantiacibacter arachoides]GGD57042.1 hypothetical protein GCM10011411_16330 [Aurantiacibacter arachoides]